MKAENDKWITIKPNGEDSKGRHLLLKDGESPKDAIERTYKSNEKIDKYVSEYKEYFNDAQLKEFKKELARFDEYKGLENVDVKQTQETFKTLKPEEALQRLKDTNDLQERFRKEDKLRKRFYDYVKKSGVKDDRLYELGRFIGSFENYFIDKIPTFDEFRQDTRYSFNTALALKYLADEKGFEHFDNISDREMAKVKAGYEKFKEILSKDNKGTKKMKAENRIDLNIDNKGKGRRFESRFLQAGLVKYSFGVCLLSKEVIDRFAYKFVGCPVIIDHKDITDANAKDERVGVISKVWYNEYDGWFWCEGVVFDDEAISLIKDKGYNVSCQYNIDDYTENTANALHNGNPYDITILDGTPEHLAIVKNPRYEEALIAVNKGEDMKAENTEFRTGYDSEGDAYVYPLEGADDKKSDKKEKKNNKKDNNNIIDKHFEQEYKHYNGDKEPTEDLDKVKKSMENVDKSNYTNKDIANINRYINEAESADFIEFAKEMRKKYKDLPLESNDEYFKREREDKPFNLDKQATKSEDKKESNLKVGDTARYNGTTWVKVEKIDGNKAIVTPIHKEDIEKKRFGEREQVPLETLRTEKQVHKQLKLFNSLETELKRFMSLIAKNFDESKHDRDKDGKFTDSGNFSGESVDEQEAKLVKELKRLEKNGQDVSEIYKKLTGKEWGKKEAKKESKKENKPVRKSQKSDSVKFDKIGKVLISVLKDAEKSYKESK